MVVLSAGWLKSQTCLKICPLCRKAGGGGSFRKPLQASRLMSATITEPQWWSHKIECVCVVCVCVCVREREREREERGDGEREEIDRESRAERERGWEREEYETRVFNGPCAQRTSTIALWIMGCCWRCKTAQGKMLCITLHFTNTLTLTHTHTGTFISYPYRVNCAEKEMMKMSYV